MRKKYEQGGGKFIVNPAIVTVDNNELEKVGMNNVR